MLVGICSLTVCVLAAARRVSLPSLFGFLCGTEYLLAINWKKRNSEGTEEGGQRNGGTQREGRKEGCMGKVEWYEGVCYEGV